MRKQELANVDSGKSAEISRNTLNDAPVPVSKNELESVVKTTDSINILSNANDVNVVGGETRDFYFVREAILHSYDLARRKITSEYKRVVDTNNFVDSQFFAIQIVIRNFGKKWDIRFVNSVIAKFAQTVVEKVALGKTVYFSEGFVIEPIIYYHKILPAWRTTPNFALLTNAMTWREILNGLLQDRKLTASAEEVVAEYIHALIKNVANGYYVKMDRFLVLQIAPGAEEKVVLFSSDTLNKVNAIYSKYSVGTSETGVNRYDVLEHFSYNHRKIKGAILAEREKAKVAATVERKFVPRDLTQELEYTKMVDLQQEAPAPTMTTKVVSGYAATESEEAVNTKTRNTRTLEINDQSATTTRTSEEFASGPATFSDETPSAETKTEQVELINSQEDVTVSEDNGVQSVSETDSETFVDESISETTSESDSYSLSKAERKAQKVEAKREKKLKKAEAKQLKKDLKLKAKEEKRLAKQNSESEREEALDTSTFDESEASEDSLESSSDESVDDSSMTTFDDNEAEKDEE